MRQMLLYYSTDKKDKGRSVFACFVKSMKITPQKLAGILETNVWECLAFTFRCWGGNADLVDRAIDSGVSKNVVALPFYSPT